MDHPNHITNHEKGKYLTYEDYLINTFFRNDRKSLWIAKAGRAAALTSMGKTDKIEQKAGGEKMKLTQLHYFCEVYRQRNVSRAAEKLNISQPSISAAIRAFPSPIWQVSLWCCFQTAFFRRNRF